MYDLQQPLAVAINMKSIAGNLQLISDMYNAGFLCKCKRRVFKENQLNIDDTLVYKIKHNKNCEGKRKFIGLLNTK